MSAPHSAFERAAWAAALRGADENAADVLRALVAHDVSAVVRAAAAANQIAPIDVVRYATRDRASRVRAAALNALAALHGELKEALEREADPILVAGALAVATDCDATIASELVEHDCAQLRAEAVRFAEIEAVRPLLADECGVVRKAARVRLGETKLAEIDVRRVLAKDGPRILDAFYVSDLRAFKAAVHALELQVSTPGNEEAGMTLSRFVKRHKAFACALDFGREVEDRLLCGFDEDDGEEMQCLGDG